MKKNVKDTSIETYYDLIDTGVLGNMQEEVLICFSNIPNSTDKEISVKYGIDINVVTGRRNELVKMGIIESGEKRPCKVTGRLSYTWHIRDKIQYRKLNKPTKLKCKYCKGNGYILRC